MTAMRSATLIIATSYHPSPPGIRATTAMPVNPPTMNPARKASAVISCPTSARRPARPARCPPGHAGQREFLEVEGGYPASKLRVEVGISRQGQPASAERQKVERPRLLVQSMSRPFN